MAALILGGGALPLGQVMLADLFADRDHDWLPFHHRAAAERPRHCDFHPSGSEVGRDIDMSLLVVHCRPVIRGHSGGILHLRQFGRLRSSGTCDTPPKAGPRNRLSPIAFVAGITVSTLAATDAFPLISYAS